MVALAQYPYLQTTAGLLRAPTSDTDNVVTRALAAGLALSTRVTGDTVSRFTLGADGLVSWGAGSGAADVFLQRDSPGFLRTNDTGLALLRNAAGSQALSVKVTGDASSRFVAYANGNMEWGAGSSRDAFLQRSGTSALRFADTLVEVLRAASTNVALRAEVNGDTSFRFNLYADGKHEWGPGNASTDVVLSRIGSALLRVDGGLQSSGTSAAAKGFATRVTGDVVERLTVGADGKMSWGDGALAQDAVLARIGTTRLDFSGADIGVTRAAASSGAYRAQVTGDANTRFFIFADGKQEWGDGTNARDVFLYRSAANTLVLDTAFLRVLRSATANTVFQALVNGEAQSRFAVLANGQLEWGDGTNARDSKLSRAAASWMSFVDTFVMSERANATDSAIGTRKIGDATSRWVMTADGGMAWGDGTLARDTTLSRSAAGELLTARIKHVLGSTGTTALAVYVTAEANGRFFLRADGQMQWGDGTNAPDTFLARQTTGTLRLADTFLESSRASTGVGTFGSRVNGDATWRHIILANGQLEWGDGTNARDVTLSRTGASALSLAAALTLSGAAGSVWTSSSSVATTQFRALGSGTAFSSNAATLTSQILLLGLLQGDTNARIYVDHAGKFNWGPGGTTTQDVSVERDAAGVLRVNGSLRATVSLKDTSYTTAGRPAAATVGAGACVYDTTLSKPIWSDGTVWRDAAGTAV